MLIVLFLMLVPALAQESAIFFSQLPPGPVEAGKTLTFSLSITNTGTESWVSGTFLIFVKMYNFDIEYLTETDTVRQIVEVQPGETLSTGVSFEIPLNYAGIYYYTVNVEIEDKRILESHYFKLTIQPFVPKPEEKLRLTGNFRLGYQASERSQPNSNFSLSLADRISLQEYRTVFVSGKDLGLESAYINTFLITHILRMKKGGDKTELFVGDTSSALSPLTVNKLRGLKVGFTRGKSQLVGLVGVNRDASSSKTSAGPSIYGFELSTDLTEDLSLGVNFAGLISNEPTQSLSEATPNSKSTLSLGWRFR